MAVIGVEPAVKYSFVLKAMQTRRKGQYNAELILSPRLYIKPLITPITAIQTHDFRDTGATLRWKLLQGVYTTFKTSCKI